MRRTPLWLAVPAALASSLVLAGPAAAHKMKVFATAEGATISGYAYFNTGNRAQDSKVVVTGPDGAGLAEMTTDAEGSFRFQANRRIDHRITVDGGDGHAASYTVAAGELPDDLPGGGAPAPAPAAVAPPPSAPAPAAAIPADAALRNLIDQSVAHQIRPLREQIDAYQEKIWWHDVLGGIGYILGLGGLAYGLTERRARRADSAGSQRPLA